MTFSEKKVVEILNLNFPFSFENVSHKKNKMYKYAVHIKSLCACLTVKLAN